MSYQVLARKWRPKNFSEVVGQKHITRTLTNSILSDKIAHAYLLTGTRGIGKTTIARIFAKAIRCTQLSPAGEPCLTCDSCQGVSTGNSLDYIEIDGASNNSVDDIRDLIENVQYLPTTGKYKVYVIDEVHMLSVNAFNALLKTLEEPPKHVVFIFATTDPQKLLGTILSRCQRFDFKNATNEELTNHVEKVALAEGITFESKELMSELAKQGRGSFRDTLSLLDQILSLAIDKKVNEETLLLSLGMAKTSSIKNILNGIFSKDFSIAQKAYKEVLNENVDLKNFSLQLLDKLYELIDSINTDSITSNNDYSEEVLSSLSVIELLWIYENLLKDFEWALSSMAPENAIEMSIKKIILREQILKQENIAIHKKKTELKEASAHNESETPVVEETPKAPLVNPLEEAKAALESEETIIEAKNEAENIEEKISIPPVGSDVERSWEGFIKYLYDGSNSATAINLERGNLLNTDSFGKKDTVYKVAFEKECKIFYDYLSEFEHKKALITLLAAFLGMEPNEIQIDFEILEDEEVIASNFKSSADIKIQNEENAKEEQRNKLLDNKYIKDAEKIFNSKVDKVVLNDK